MFSVILGVILDGLVLLGLMSIVDRKNPNRDFLETGLVAFLLAIASIILNRFTGPVSSVVALAPYACLCLVLLHKLPGIPWDRAAVITVAFVGFKVVEPILFKALLGTTAL